MIRTRTPTHAAEIVLIGVLVLEGVLALGGGVMLVSDPSGGLLQMPPEWLHGTPFATYLIPGLLLGAALGVLPLFAAFALRRIGSVPALRRVERALGMDTAWLASVASGMAIVIWIVTQIAMVRMFHPMQGFIFALGASIALLSFAPSVRRGHRVRRG